jgi:RNA polymerase sigma factor (sigma-70 family)
VIISFLISFFRYYTHRRLEKNLSKKIKKVKFRQPVPAQDFRTENPNATMRAVKKLKPDEILPTRVSLLDRIRNWKDDQSWDEFCKMYRRLIHGFARKAGLGEEEAQDVVQETMIAVARTIENFEYDPSQCSFKSWLRHLAQKRIADAYRKKSRQPAVQMEPASASNATALAERVPAPESLDLDGAWEEEWQQRILDAAVARVKAEVSPEQFQVFDFYVLRQMPVKEVAAALGVNIAQVYLAKHRVSRLLKKQVRKLETEIG